MYIVKAVIIKAIQNQVTNTGRFLTAKYIRHTLAPGRQGAVPILDIRKGGYCKQQVSPNTGIPTTGVIYHMAASTDGGGRLRYELLQHTLL